MFKYPQSVGSEVVSLFILLPFQLSEYIFAMKIKTFLRGPAVVSLVVPIISFTKVEVQTEIIIFKVCVFLGTSIRTFSPQRVVSLPLIPKQISYTPPPS